MMSFFENIKILDASRVLAGPFATLILSDLGAEILKIENPDGGDETRSYQPMANDMSSYFISVNRNKRSVCLNLKDSNDREKFNELLKTSDVFVHNFKYSTAKNLGLTFQDLKKINDKIIYVNISAYGQNTTRAEEPGYDIVMQAETGLMSVTGFRDNYCRVGNSTVDIYTGYMAAIMIISALYKKSVDPDFQGIEINVPLFNSGIYSMTYLFGYYSTLNMDPVPQGISHQGIVPYQKFDTSDDPIIVAVANDNIWRKFCKAIGRDDLINNPKFKDNKSRVENRTELISILQKIFYSKGSAEWLNIFKEYEIPSSKLNKISDIVNSNFVRESEAIVMKDLGGKTFYFPAFPAIVNGKYLPFYKTNPPRLCQG